eukprot:5392764-Pleurochrysis_carterae.AAC.1
MEYRDNQIAGLSRMAVSVGKGRGEPDGSGLLLKGLLLWAFILAREVEYYYYYRGSSARARGARRAF